MKTLKTYMNESMRMIDAGQFAYNSLLKHKHIFTNRQWNQIELLTAKAEEADERNPEFPYLCMTKGPKHTEKYVLVIIGEASTISSVEKELSRLGKTAEISQTISLHEITIKGDILKFEIEGNSGDGLASTIEAALSICNKYKLL